MAGRHRFGYVLWHTERIPQKDVYAAIGYQHDTEAPSMFHSSGYFVPVAVVVVSHFPLHQAFLTALRVWYRSMGAAPRINKETVCTRNKS